jgi:hypothetical protein
MLPLASLRARRVARVSAARLTTRAVTARRRSYATPPRRTARAFLQPQQGRSCHRSTRRVAPRASAPHRACCAVSCALSHAWRCRASAAPARLAFFGMRRDSRHAQSRPREKFGHAAGTEPEGVPTRLPDLTVLPDTAVCARAVGTARRVGTGTATPLPSPAGWAAIQHAPRRGPARPPAATDDNDRGRWWGVPVTGG